MPCEVLLFNLCSTSVLVRGETRNGDALCFEVLLDMAHFSLAIEILVQSSFECVAVLAKLLFLRICNLLLRHRDSHVARLRPQ